jgi:hypothetical protein
MDDCIIRCIVGLEQCFFVTDVNKEKCCLGKVHTLETCLKEHSQLKQTVEHVAKVATNS